MRERVPPTPETLLDLIEAHVIEHGYPPSIGDLAKATRAGRATIHGRLKELVADGSITIRPGRARAITINRKNPE